MTNLGGLGVWLNQDGTVGTPDPSNPYRYVGNNPTNAVDPTGLAADAVDKAIEIEFTKTYTQDKKLVSVTRKGTLEAKPSVTHKGEADWVEIGFSYPYHVGVTPNLNFLQFSRTYLTNNDKKVEENGPGSPLNSNTGYPASPTNLRIFYGKTWHVDSGQLNKLYYNQGGGDSDREVGGDNKKLAFLKIWDKPDDPNPDPAKYKSINREFDTYLILDGQIVAHVLWGKVDTSDGTSWDRGDFKIQKVEKTGSLQESIAPVKLPLFNLALGLPSERFLFGGYTNTGTKIAPKIGPAWYYPDRFPRK